MKNFQQTVQTAISNAYDHFESDGELGVATAYYSPDTKMAFVHALEADGTQEVCRYMEILKHYLPANYALSHNSPTDGNILVVAQEIPVEFNPRMHKEYFEKFVYDYINKGIEAPRVYKAAVLYFVHFMETAENSVQVELNRLRHDDEFLNQLVAKHITPPFQLEVTEEHVRDTFNWTFSQLDDCRSAGTMYVGDNGCFLLRYYDISEKETAFLVQSIQKCFSTAVVTKGGTTLEIEIC